MGAQGHRRTVAVLFSGRSVEHEISVLTALRVMRVIDPAHWEVLPVYVAQDGRWFTDPALGLRETYAAGPPAGMHAMTEVTLLPKPGQSGLRVVSSPKARKPLLGRRTEPEDIAVDVFLPLLHGSYGEDGCVQGLFELAGVAYAGSDVLASALGMNKWACKRLAQSGGLTVALPDVLVAREELQRELATVRSRIQRELPGAVVVKPCSIGSSVGVVHASSSDAVQLDAALIQAARYDTHVLVEPRIELDFELNVAVMLRDGAAVASSVERPEASAIVLSYEDKYLGDNTGSAGLRAGDQSEPPRSAPPPETADFAGQSSRSAIDPPDVDSKLRQRARESAVRIYEMLGCRGVARVDFMVRGNELYFNEINTLPGSLSLNLWSRSDPPIPPTAVLNLVLDEAFATHSARQAVSRDFGFRALPQAARSDKLDG